jgi:hypothetical protein|tara:strand:- start:171 stop:368 length:198 start_codon:yes stop_codon:yes gene_type:complete
VAGLLLSQLGSEFPDLEINKVEFLTNLRQSREKGVRSIPTLVYEDRQLGGFILTKNKIRRFLQSL